MKKNFCDYSLYVFDLDGTLYDQPRLRLIMAARLGTYYLLRPHRVGELFILQHFRRVKDDSVTSSEDEIIEKVASDKHTSFEKVRSIVDRWIYENPLSALALTKDEKLAEVIQKLRAKGKRVVILSDYPTKDKLAALDIEVDASFGPDDPRIDELKPSPKGLLVIMEDLNIPAGDVLMIGDRAEKDGECAKAAGVDSLILERSVAKRKDIEV